LIRIARARPLAESGRTVNVGHTPLRWFTSHNRTDLADDQSSETMQTLFAASRSAGLSNRSHRNVLGM